MSKYEQLHSGELYLPCDEEILKDIDGVEIRLKEVEKLSKKYLFFEKKVVILL